MKYLLTVALLMVVLVTFGQSNPIDGKWKGSRETPNGSFDIEYTFKVEGNILTGSWKTQRGESKIEDGKVDGKTFTFTISFGERKITNTGELVSENEILVKNERSEMKLTRVKD